MGDNQAAVPAIAETISNIMTLTQTLSTIVQTIHNIMALGRKDDETEPRLEQLEELVAALEQRLSELERRTV